MDYSDEQLKTAFGTLPDDLKVAVADIKTEEIIFDIGKKYNLHIDQIGLLVEETGLVMLGLTPYYQFTDNIQKKLGIDRALAENITMNVNTEIFLPIRELLKQGQGETTLSTSVGASDTVFEQKMGKLFNLPKETNKPKSNDPYLESIE